MEATIKTTALQGGGVFIDIVCESRIKPLVRREHEVVCCEPNIADAVPLLLGHTPSATVSLASPYSACNQRVIDNFKKFNEHLILEMNKLCVLANKQKLERLGLGTDTKKGGSMRNKKKKYQAIAIGRYYVQNKTVKAAKSFSEKLKAERYVVPEGLAEALTDASLNALGVSPEFLFAISRSESKYYREH